MAPDDTPTTFRSELPRKLGHMAVGLCALTLRWFPAWLAVVGAAAAVVFNALWVHRATGGIFLRGDERKRRFSAGVLLYPVAVLTLLAVFYHRLELAAGVWAVLAFADAAAGLAGLGLGGPALPWNPRKRWTGLAAFVVVGTVTSAAFLRWTQLGAPSPWIGDAFLSTGGATPAATVWLWAACLKTASAAAFVESLDTGWEDNLLLVLTAGAVLWMGSLVTPERALDLSGELATAIAIGAVLTSFPAVAARLAGAVGTGGAVVGWILATALFGAAGWPGLLVFGAFFLLGAAATRVGWRRKALLGLAQDAAVTGGRRGVGNAVANTVVGVVCAWLAFFTDQGALWTVAMTAAFATAAFDTVASEVGKAFGSSPLHLLTFRRVAPGSAGAVSLAGSTAGLAAAAVVTGTAWVTGAVGPGGASAAAAGAVVGGMVESVVGALLPRGGRQRGDVLNALNTAVGAAVSVAIWAALAS